MKYRSLTIDELEILKDDFISFLALNGIAADDWKDIQLTDSAKHDKVIELFSEVVFSKILRQIKFLELKANNIYSAIQCNADEMVMITLEKKPAGNELYSSQKAYTVNREEDIYALLNKGFVKSDGKLFKKLWLLKLEQN